MSSSLHSVCKILICLTLVSVGHAAVKLPAKAPARCTVTDLPYDDGTDVNAGNKYEVAVEQLLLNKKFRELDCLADVAREKKLRFHTGWWKVHILSRALMRPPLHATEVDWRRQIALLQEWSAQRPQSINPRIALAWAYDTYAWEARGTGYSDEVSASGWQLFRQRLAKAKFALDQAKKLETKCPEWYSVMIQIAKDQSWPKEKARALFEEAIAFEPDYDAYYPYYAENLLTKWGGESGEMENFAREQADRLGGDKGDRIYFRIAAFINCPCPTPDNMGMLWPRIKAGYEATEKEFGYSFITANKFAVMAFQYDDYLAADGAFKKIEEQFDLEAWRTEEYFHRTKSNANVLAADIRIAQGFQDEGEKHSLEPAGAQYLQSATPVAARMLQDCVKDTNDPKFTLYLKIDQQGQIVDARFPTSAEIRQCFFTKIQQAFMNREKPFSPPPSDNYWIRIEIDRARLNAAN